MTDRLGTCELQLKRHSFHLDVEFNIPSKGVLGIFGESGSGKTSILRCLAGLEPQVKGCIEIDQARWLTKEGFHLSPDRREIGYVFQDSRLFSHLSVKENLDYGRKRRVYKNVGDNWSSTIDLLGISHLLNRKTHQLSGGEQQRVAIARALLSHPKLLLMDEPLASLDEARKQEVLPFLEKLHREIKTPIIYITHSIEEIQCLCDQLIVVSKGKKTFEGKMSEALTSSQAPFLSSAKASTVLSGVVIRYCEETAVTEISLQGEDRFYLPEKLEIGGEVNIRIIATDVSLSLNKPKNTTVLNILPCILTEVASQSAHHLTLRLEYLGQAILARVSRKSYIDLKLVPEMVVFAQIKAVSIQNI